MKLKYALKFMFHLFCIITTFQLIFVATTWTIGGEEFSLVPLDLFKLPLIAFVSVLPSFLLVFKDTISHKALTIRMILHFVLTSGIVFGLLIYFGWLSTKNAVFIVPFFLAIYISAYITQEIRARKLAKQLNEKLNAFHNSENATHHD